MKENEREITREELYNLIWTKPITVLAKEFGISDTGLAKICKRLDVPRPYRGYWRLLETGRKRSIPPLPPAKKDTPSKALISPNSQPARPEDPELRELIKTENDPANKIVVAETLRKAHPLVSVTRKRFERGYADSYGRLFPGWTETGLQALDISASKKSVHRALKIMDALIKAVEARGGKIEVKDRKTFCLFDEARVPLQLTEKVKQHDHKLTPKQRETSYIHDKWFYTPTGELTLTVDESSLPKHRFRDKNNKQLEDQLNDVMVALMTASKIVHARNLEREQEQVRWLERERQRQEAERLRQIEQRRRQQLDNMMANWTKSRQLHRFLDRCEKILSAGKTISPDSTEGRWLAWARAYADQLNPFTNSSLEAVAKMPLGQ